MPAAVSPAQSIACGARICRTAIAQSVDTSGELFSAKEAGAMTGNLGE
jgi:hypothetical protein